MQRLEAMDIFDRWDEMRIRGVEDTHILMSFAAEILQLAIKELEHSPRVPNPIYIYIRKHGARSLEDPMHFAQEYLHASNVSDLQKFARMLLNFDSEKATYSEFIVIIDDHMFGRNTILAVPYEKSPTLFLRFKLHCMKSNYEKRISQLENSLAELEGAFKYRPPCQCGAAGGDGYVEAENDFKRSRSSASK